MTVYTLDPLTDDRWSEFIDRHHSASVFHSQPWLEALRLTYGYRPLVYTTTPPSLPLSNGIVLCEIKSWLTGRRMVSLPFSDHCEPLLDTPAAVVAIAAELKKISGAGTWKYIELRPKSEISNLGEAVQQSPCYLHTLDLRSGLDELFRGFHKKGVQQMIRRAEREALVYEHGNSEHLLQAFYRLMILTRRRHQLPPQPIQWFRNLISCMGDKLRIRVAFKDGKEVASILTLEHRGATMYKYGCSDEVFQNLGGTPFLLWQAIMEAKAAGLMCMDFGRSDSDNLGLIVFKERWGAKPSTLTYLRWSRNPAEAAGEQRSAGMAKRLFVMMPNILLETTGRILYRHVG